MCAEANYPEQGKLPTRHQFTNWRASIISRIRLRGVKERIVEEAEHIAAETTHWKSSGERMRELLEERKAAPHAERPVEAAPWKRLSAARNTFTKRRKAHFATLEEQREDVWMREVKLVVDAESLAALTAWGPTAGTFRDLMRPGRRRPAGWVGTPKRNCGTSHTQLSR